MQKIAKSTGKVADLEEIMAGESNYQEKPKATGKFIEKKETENHFELKNRTLNLEDFQHEKSQSNDDLKINLGVMSILIIFALLATSASVLSTPSEKAKTEENRKTSRTAGLSGIEESDESSDGEDTLAKVNIKVVRDRLKNSLKKTLGFQYVPGFKGSKSTAQLNVTSKPTAPNILRRNAAGSNTYPRVRKSVYLEEARARRKMYKSSMMSSASASAESTVLSASERLKKPSVMLLSKTRRAGIPPGSPKRIQRQVERPSLSRRKPAKVVLKKQRRASLVDEAKITKSTSPMNDVQTRSPPQSLDADASPTVCQDHTAFHTPVVTAQMSQSVTEDNPQALEAVVSSEKQTILTHTSEPNYISAITCDSDERSSNGDTPPVTPPSLRPARARRPRAYDPEVFVTQWPGQKTKVSTTGSRPSSQTDSVAEVPNEIPTADKNTVGQFRAESSSFMPSEADASKMAEFDDVIDNLIDHQNFRCLVCRRMCRDIK